MNNITKYYDIKPTTINFIVKNDYDYSLFKTCLISLQDDIKTLFLKINIETNNDFMDIIESLNKLHNFNFNISIKNEEEGLNISNNCIFLPNTLSYLNEDVIVEATPEYIKKLLKEIEETCIVPKKVIIFKENESLTKEQIPSIMKMVFSNVLRAIDITEIIHRDIKLKQGISIE